MYSKITVLTESCFNESIKIRIYLLNLQYLITYLVRIFNPEFKLEIPKGQLIYLRIKFWCLQISLKEICQNFGWLFGRFEDTKISFWD